MFRKGDEPISYCTQVGLILHQRQESDTGLS